MLEWPMSPTVTARRLVRALVTWLEHSAILHTLALLSDRLCIIMIGKMLPTQTMPRFLSVKRGYIALDSIIPTQRSLCLTALPIEGSGAIALHDPS